MAGHLAPADNCVRYNRSHFMLLADRIEYFVSWFCHSKHFQITNFSKRHTKCYCIILFCHIKDVIVIVVSLRYYSNNL